MAKSPLIESQDLVSLSVLIEGTALDDTLAVNKIEITSNIGEMPSAAVAFNVPFGSALKAAMEKLSPGKSIDIKLGYQHDNQLVFSGIITNQSTESTELQWLTLVVQCYDKALVLDQVQDTRLFSDLTDTEIINTLAKESGLLTEVDDTKVKHQRLSQFQMTDWSFIQARAKANNLLAYAENGKILVKANAINSEADLLLTQGKDVQAFKLNTKVNEFPNLRIGARNILRKGGKGAKKIKQKPSSIKGATTAVTASGELTFIGNASPRLNSTIELAEFGEQYNGKQLITGFHHLVEEGRWETTVNVGLETAAAAKASSQLPGVLPGKVLSLEGDPLGAYRILVEIPALDTTGSGVWSRLANFYASTGKGAFFLPEIGDEVILGFEENDLGQPVILGALYSSEKAPPFSIEDDNHLKGILTRSGLKLEFDDDNKQLTLATPASNTIVLSDDESSIAISDQHGNQITMDSDGIKIKSGKDINLEATGNINLKASQSIAAKASAGNLTGEGVQVQLKAQASFSAEGGAQAEVKSGGVTTVKGSMVMIN
ncbi:MAG: phage baseplate assembly protein V [Lewinella sp.]|uniref:phage baseplate assembly protein V n=1 Tax=Lewinella sp. TaxID=2004506 RepID=UPI003D6B2181